MRHSFIANCAVLSATLLFVAGCGSKDDEFKEYGKSKASDTKKAHVHEEGPHDGHLIELGEEEYHAELVFDEKSRKTTLYILGSDPETAHPIDAKEVEFHLEEGDGYTELIFAAAPQEDDPDGKSSRFELAADDLPAAIDEEEKFVGHIDVTIGGKVYEGEVDHDHEGHDEDDEADHPEDHDKEKGHDKDK